MQELPAIEVLARVDVICLDKTGTITTGAMDVTDVDVARRRSATTTSSCALAALAWSDPDPNATQPALQRRFPDPPDWSFAGVVPFSSARKWSGASFDGQGTWSSARPSSCSPTSATTPIEDRRRRRQPTEGKRVLLLAAVREWRLGRATLPGGLDRVALVLLEDPCDPTPPRPSATSPSRA